MTPRRYVTVSKRSNGWRVSVKQMTGDANRLDTLLVEQMCRTEASAMRKARDYAHAYGAEIIG